jgi:hypothetical protein
MYGESSGRYCHTGICAVPSQCMIKSYFPDQECKRIYDSD